MILDVDPGSVPRIQGAKSTGSVTLENLPEATFASTSGRIFSFNGHWRNRPLAGKGSISVKIFMIRR
jgi:hypothetical protein